MNFEFFEFWIDTMVQFDGLFKFLHWAGSRGSHVTLKLRTTCEDDCVAVVWPTPISFHFLYLCIFPEKLRSRRVSLNARARACVCVCMCVWGLVIVQIAESGIISWHEKGGKKKTPSLFIIFLFNNWFLIQPWKQDRKCVHDKLPWWMH